MKHNEDIRPKEIEDCRVLNCSEKEARVVVVVCSIAGMFRVPHLFVAVIEKLNLLRWDAIFQQNKV